jgi:hypothetical protein
LQLKHFSRNIIVGADSSISIDGKKINPKNLRRELVSRGIVENTPIMLHFHEKVLRSTFDEIVGKFKAEGFSRLDTSVYNE